MRLAGLASVLAGVALVVAGRGQTSSQEAAPTPVITAAEVWNAYPAAQVSGVLRLTHGCLILRDSVVFWPLGTGWDADTRSVTFGSAALLAPVGESSRGGGGYYEQDDGPGFAALIGAAGATAIWECQRRTGARGVVFAYPDGAGTS